MHHYQVFLIVGKEYVVDEDLVIVQELVVNFGLVEVVARVSYHL